MAELAKTYERCIYFRGIQNPCEAGVPLESVKDTSQRPYQWPCVQIAGGPVCKTTCEKRVLMTPEQHAAEEREIAEAVAKYDASLKAGKCPECGKPVEPTSISGRCRYAACGHRLGQVDVYDWPTP